MSNSTIDARRVAAISCGVGFATQIYAVRAENAEIWDADDKRYIDFGAGVAVVNTGHRHPKVVASVKAQLDCFTHTCHQVVPYESYVHLAERLNKIVPGEFSKKTIFVTTGAEATENAVKIARAATNRSAVIAFTGRLSWPHIHEVVAHRESRALQGRLRADDARRVSCALPGRAL
jgi:4-aminobutyrate aminotransferase